ncbi:DEAD/DEAH box helicase family protein [Nostoc sp. NIES-2111]
MLIHYLDALAGAGKTHFLVRHAHALALSGQKVLIVQPTKDLIDQTHATELVPLYPNYPVRRIHSGTVGDAVVDRIVTHLLGAEVGQGEILFITHQAFLLVPFWPRRQDWYVIVDELPQVLREHTYNLPRTHAVLTSALETVSWR